jgi:hypothetical protein
MRARVFFRPAAGEMTMAVLTTALTLLALLNDGILTLSR